VRVWVGFGASDAEVREVIAEQGQDGKDGEDARANAKPPDIASKRAARQIEVAKLTTAITITRSPIKCIISSCRCRF
jgi:hypothetical protein